jgi:pilus assembly protein Flp/PilA
MGATSFALRADRRGASLVEYLIVVGCIALLAFGGWAAFGRAVDDKIRGQADCIVSGAGCEGDPQGAEAAPAPTEPAQGAAPLSYEDQLAAHLQTLADSFTAIAGDDGRIDEDDLRDALNSSNPDVRAAAQWFLDNDSARHALDVGQGDGDVDGDISREDIAGLQEAMQDGSLVELLADTANGEGERDGEISRDDLLALAEDEGVPQGVRDWAATTAEQMPEEEGCNGWSDFTCHVGNAGEWAYDVTGLDSLVDASGLDSALEWVDESIYQNLPGPLQTAWDFYYGFNVLGPVRLVTGLVDGVGGVLQLGTTYVGNLIDDPWGTIQSTAEFATNPIAQAEFAWNLGSAIVSDYAERCPSSATEAGACTFEVALEVVLAVTTGGSGNAASHADDLRYLRYLDDVDDATDAARAVNHADDIADAERVLDDVDDVPRIPDEVPGPGGAANAAPAADIGSAGRLNMDDVLDQIPEGTPNTWNPNAPASGGYTGPGFRYEWTGADGTRYRVWGHGANPNAPPGSNAANGPTVRVQIGNRYATTRGETVRNLGDSPIGEANANDSHIPLDGWTPP